MELPDYEGLGIVVDGEFRSAVLREELRGFSADHDFVVLGLPNDDPAVDLPILGRHVDVAVLVIRLGVTRRDTVAAVLAALTKSGVSRVFAVTVDLGRRGLSRKGVDAGDVFGGKAMPVRSEVVEESGTGEPDDSVTEPLGEDAHSNGTSPAVPAGRAR